MRALAVVMAVGLVAAGARAADDCLEPLRANAGWSCHADASNGQAVDYCLERTSIFGADPASQFFKLIATGPYSSYCSCGAKGKLPGAAFGEDESYLCLYPDTDAVVSGKVTKRRIAGQTYSAAYDLRTVFSCEPDPACDVQPVLDPDLPPDAFADLLPGEIFHVPVTGGGAVDVAYLPGCGGYASEAPQLVLHVDPAEPGDLDIALAMVPSPDSLLVLAPSGAVHCVDEYAYLPAERGTYRAWVVRPAPGTASFTVKAAYHLGP